MNPAIRLCFSSEGLLDGEVITNLSLQSNDTVVMFTDGSDAAYQHLKNFDFDALRGRISHIGLARTPLAEMRVRQVDNTLSKPHYVYSQKHQMQWVCSNVAAPHLNISISDISKQDATQADLGKVELDQMCFLTYVLWSSMRVAEDRLCFPAAVIDRLAKLTYYLTPNTLDLNILRRETGLSTLGYNPDNDILSVEVVGDVYTIKMEVLNRFYGDYILPIFNKLLGRRTRIVVTVNGGADALSDPTEMSYGQLGAIVENFSRHVQQKLITDDTPIDPQDLLAHSKKVRINDESCLWPTSQQTMANLVESSYDQLVHSSGHNDQPTGDFEIASTVREPESVEN